MKVVIHHDESLRAFNVSIGGVKPILITEKLLKRVKSGKTISVDIPQTFYNLQKG